MIALSVAIIAKNEADRIAQAIGSVQGLAREVVVLDSGSTDDTVAVARALGATVQVTDWPGHVAQKNRALAACQHDWVLSIDADEALSPELHQAIARALAEEPATAGFEVCRLGHWLGAPIRHGTWYPDRRVRLFDRRRGRWVGDDPHDHVALAGPSERLGGDLLHHPYRSLGEHLGTIDRYTEVAAAALRSRGVGGGWLDVALRPFLHFAKAYLWKLGFLDGVRGLALAWLGASYVALKWTRVVLASTARREAD